MPRRKAAAQKTPLELPSATESADRKGTDAAKCDHSDHDQDDGAFPVTVADHGDKGRGCELTRDVQAGETVLRVVPLVVAVNDGRLADTCAFCLGPVRPDSQDTCVRCGVLALCSRCRVPGSRSAVLHADECASLRLLFTSPLFQRPFRDSRTLRLMLRLLYVVVRERAGTLPPAVRPEEAAERPDVVVDEASAIDELQDHLDDMSEALLVTLGETVKQLKFLVDAWARISHERCLAMLARYYSNAFELEAVDRGWVALGLCPSASFFNHSCAPNCHFRLDAHGWLCVSAARSLTAGTELSIAYVPPVFPVARRQRRLQRHFFFQCTCERCQAEWTEQGGRPDADMGRKRHAGPHLSVHADGTGSVSSDEEQLAVQTVSALVSGTQTKRRAV